MHASHKVNFKKRITGNTMAASLTTDIIRMFWKDEMDTVLVFADKMHVALIKY